jgi:hypothetical protein
VRTNRTTLLVALALLLTATAASFGANPIIGTWKLNEVKSKFAPGAAKNTVVTYAASNRALYSGSSRNCLFAG